MGINKKTDPGKESKEKPQEASELVDADHDFLEPNIEEIKSNRKYSVLAPTNHGNVNVIISERRSAEVLLIRMFENEINKIETS